MGFSWPEVSCGGCELTRLWMLCRVDPRGLGRSFRPGKPSNSPWEVVFICPFVVLNPTDLGATIVVAPGQMPSGFLPSPNADCLPFLVKLVPCSRTNARRFSTFPRRRLPVLFSEASTVLAHAKDAKETSTDRPHHVLATRVGNYVLNS